MKWKIYILIFSYTFFSYSQELKTLKDSLQLKKIAYTKQKQKLNQLQKEMSEIENKINFLKGFVLNAIGTIGVDFSKSTNWYANSRPNLYSEHIITTFNISAKLERKKIFWNNASTVNLGWKKIDDIDTPTKEDIKYENKTDEFKLSSLFGYKLKHNFSISSLAEYRTTLIENFNDPSFLNIGIGSTWTRKKITITINPLDGNIIFSKNKPAKNYKSSLGGKLAINFSPTFNRIKLISNFTSFISYKSSDYSEWTWANVIQYPIWRKLGLGVNFNLRQNKQQVFNNPTTKFKSLKDTENTLQTFWLFGLSYSI